MYVCASVSKTKNRYFQIHKWIKIHLKSILSQQILFRSISIALKLDLPDIKIHNPHQASEGIEANLFEMIAHLPLLDVEIRN